MSHRQCGRFFQDPGAARIRLIEGEGLTVTLDPLIHAPLAVQVHVAPVCLIRNVARP